MNPSIFFTILIIGFSGIVAQVLLLRELLVNFYGNELTLGIILANWVIQEATGALFIGKLIDQSKDKVKVFVIFQALFLVFLPISLYLARTFKAVLGIPFGQGVSLPVIFFSSFLIILPVSFAHGGLFSCFSKISSSIGKTYYLETIGTIIGGLFLTYFFIPYLNPFQVVFLVIIANFVISIFFLKTLCGRYRFSFLFFLLLLGALFLAGNLNRIQRSSIKKEWQARDVLDYRNSLYGNIVLTKEKNQYTFFYNGLPIITLPYPNITFVQEFGNLPLLFHKQPQDILIVSAGAGGIINEILKQPVRRVDYLELDPLLITLLKNYPLGLIRKEFSDPRLKIINLDGRFFLKHTPNRYDIILIGKSCPQDLSTNRFFSQEFFFLTKEKIKKGGILALYLPGSLNYLSRELKDLNGSIINGLKDSYNYLRVIPGDDNIILASDAQELVNTESGLISERITQRNLQDTILIPSYLDYRLSREYEQWFWKNLSDAGKITNQDSRPIALFQMLLIWNKQFSGSFSSYFAALKKLNLIGILVLITVVTLILFSIIKLKPKLAGLSIVYAIATTGFFGMLVNLVLLFAFQVSLGYLYHKIGLLISIFMAGIALGSILLTRKIPRIKNPLNLFLKLEIAMCIFACLLAWLIMYLLQSSSSLTFIVLIFLSGIFLGVEFPLANQIYLLKNQQIGQTAGTLFFADLFGGWLAGVFGSIVFLPVLGLFNTCLIIVFLKLSSLFLIYQQKFL